MISEGAPLSRMPIPHLLLALLIVAVWGTNFVVAHQGLDEFPPLTLGALRILFASVPLLPFLSRPDVPWRIVVRYGLLSGALQFGLMLYAMAGHISPGLAATLIQMQAFFTTVIAAVTAGERIDRRAMSGLAISGVGVALIGANASGTDADLIGIVCTLGAALAWSFATVVVRRARPARAVSLVAWSNLVAVPPLVAATLLLDGPDNVVASVMHASPSGWMVVLWQAYANAILGYGAWNWLLARHPASRIAPLALFAPVFGLGASAWYLSEPLPGWKLAAATAVIGGVLLGMIRAPGSAPSKRAID